LKNTGKKNAVCQLHLKHILYPILLQRNERGLQSSGGNAEEVSEQASFTNPGI
jgi:hypothetical protein